MGIPGYGSPYINYQQPFGSYAPQRGVSSYGLANPTGFPPVQSPGDLFSPTASALDFSSSAHFTEMPVSNIAPVNPFMTTSFLPQQRGLMTTQGLDNEVDVFGIGDGDTNTGTNTTAVTTDDGTATDDGETTTDEGTDSETTDGKGKKKPKMTLRETIQLELYGTTPKHPDWMAFFSKVCDDDEKPVQVHPPEGFTFGNYDDEG